VRQAVLDMRQLQLHRRERLLSEARPAERAHCSAQPLLDRARVA
jgi:hypothetical protein